MVDDGRSTGSASRSLSPASIIGPGISHKHDNPGV